MAATGWTLTASPSVSLRWSAVVLPGIDSPWVGTSPAVCLAAFRLAWCHACAHRSGCTCPGNEMFVQQAVNHPWQQPNPIMAFDSDRHIQMVDLEYEVSGHVWPLCVC